MTTAITVHPAGHPVIIIGHNKMGDNVQEHRMEPGDSPRIFYIHGELSFTVSEDDVKNSPPSPAA